MVSATRLTISSPSVEGSPLPSALGFSMDFSSSALAAEAGTEAEMRLVVVAASLSTETVTVAPDKRLFLGPEGAIETCKMKPGFANLRAVTNPQVKLLTKRVGHENGNRGQKTLF